MWGGWEDLPHACLLAKVSVYMNLGNWGRETLDIPSPETNSLIILSPPLFLSVLDR